ncbi:MAG: PQQ-like beta-propeller repeat protein [Verrucomicrobiaceae bacterium]|nr:PQQ-like beta-propeller repeat protein [Verrucomicrobiaceae bacterium]
MKTPYLLFILLAASLSSQHAVRAMEVPPAQQLIVPPGAGTSANAGFAVALSERYSLVGSPDSDVAKPGSKTKVGGAGEVFVFDAVTGRYVKRLISPKPVFGENFGYAVAASGNTAFVTAVNNDDGGLNSGIVYAIDVPSGKLIWKRSGAVGQQMGESIAVDGDNVIVGCYGQLAGNPTGSGAVSHLNRRTGEIIATYGPLAPQEWGFFGRAVAVCGNIAVVGIPDQTITGKSFQGAVAVIDLVSGQINQFTPADGLANDRFGAAVAAGDGKILVGAPEADIGGKNDQGAVYLYDANTLTLITKIKAPNEVPASAKFGNAISVSGRVAAIGAYWDNRRDGSTWLMDLNTQEIVECAIRPQSSGAEFGTCLAMNQNALLIGDPEHNVSGPTPDGRAMLIRDLHQTFAPSLQTIARTNDLAPGIDGAVFAGFGEAVISPTNHVMTVASVKGYGIKTTNNTGLWDTLSGTLDLVLQAGTAANVGTYGRPHNLAFGQNGYGKFDSRTSKGTLVLLDDYGTSAVPWISEGTQLEIFKQGQMGYTREKIGRINERLTPFTSGGELVMNYISRSGTDPVSPANDSRIAYKQMQVIDEVREGDQSPIAGINYGQLLPRVGVNGDKMIYAANLIQGSPAQNQAVFVKTHNMNNAALVARKGDAAPGAGGAVFSTFLGEGVINNKVVLHAKVNGGAAGLTEGLWTDRDGTFKAVALRGDQAPQLPPGVKFDRFIQFFMTSTLQVVFQARVSGPGINASNDIGIWYRPLNGNLFLLMREGDGAPGCIGSTINVLQRFDVDESGYYVVLASLKSGASSNQAIFFGNIFNSTPARRQPVLGVRKGTLYERNGAEQIKSISLNGVNTDALGSGSKGLGRMVNSSGAVFCLEFLDRSKALVFGKP